MPHDPNGSLLAREVKRAVRLASLHLALHAAALVALVSLLAILWAYTGAFAHARTLLRAVEPDQNEAVIRASADDCPGASRVFDLWDAGQYQDSCVTSPRDGMLVAVCAFRDTIPAGARNVAVTARRMEGCRPSAGVEWYAQIQRPVAKPVVAPVGSRLLILSSPAFEARFDRLTGTLYAFLNRSASTPAGRALNIIHSHVGAAAQVAVHSGRPGSLTPSPCAGAGYWNPTQAGALCAYPAAGVPLGGQPHESGVAVYCDGGPCSARQPRVVEWSWFRLRNFDYGPQYPGPPGALDDLLLAVRAANHGAFLELEYRFVSRRAVGYSAAQLPTVYLNRFFSSARSDTTAPRALFDPLIGGPIPAPVRYPGANWVSLEMDHPVYGSQAITIQTVLDPVFESNTVASGIQAPNISLTDLYRRVNYSYTVAARFPAGVEMAVWALIVPSAPAEVIATPFGAMAVETFLARAREHYERARSPLPLSPSAVSGGSGGHNWAWFSR